MFSFLFKGTIAKAVNDALADQTNLKAELKREIKTSMTATEIGLEDSLNTKIEAISKSIESIKSVTENIDVIKQLQEASNAASTKASTLLAGRLQKLETQVDEMKDNVDERFESADARLEAFIDVMSEKLSDLGKKKNLTPTADIFKKDICPFDLRVGRCEVWKSRPKVNDAPAACAACRAAVSLQERGVTSVSIQQITAGNSRPAQAS